MIGVDTNVLIRLLAPDDARKNEAARAFFAARTPDSPAYVSSIVLAETVWLLRRRLGYRRDAVEDVIRGMLRSDDFRIEHDERLREMLDDRAASQPEIADYLIAWSALGADCTHTVTFDRRAAKSVPGVELLG